MSDSSFLGLTKAQVEQSLAEHGTNALIRKKTKNFFQKFLENASDPIIRVLLLAIGAEIAVTLGRCNWFEIGGIWIAVLVATTVSTASEYGSEKAFEKMQALGESLPVRVLREGNVTFIPTDEIVVGDILLLQPGERIAADGILLHGQLSVDQSALNGESAEVTKRPGSNNVGWELTDPSKVFRGSVVTMGEGTVRVGRVGTETYFGKVAEDVQSSTRTSPLKIRLSKLAEQISKIGYVMAGLVGFVYLFGAFVAGRNFDPAQIRAAFSDLPFVVTTVSHALTLMITVVVVSVPEGLPMMVTVVLSSNMKRMLKDHVTVKKLVGIETAGSMNILFTDKTGTLTSGKITLDRIVTAEGSFRTVGALRAHKEIYSLLCLNAQYNNGRSQVREIGTFGNATERSVGSFFSKEPVISANLIASQPFTSETKFSSATVKTDRLLTFYKGAPERILPEMIGEIQDNGFVFKTDLSKWENEYRLAASRGERVLAVAVSSGEGKKDLCFLALLILKDPLRRGVRESVAEAIRAGIQPVMLTGDGKETATSIAAECGIFHAGGSQIVLTSDELQTMSDEDLAKELPSLRVVARALPSDKNRLVRVAQATGAVVGMTGDGINDAPSLKAADVGFAMGSGADIAKSAGDIVLTDDSISAIVKTVLYGRTIFHSIQKFITFQLIMNLAACGVSLVGQILGFENPITIVQMLWVNLMMDTLGGLAFAGEPPLVSYLRESPKQREAPILTPRLLRRIMAVGGFTLVLCIFFLTSAGVFDRFRNNDAFLTGFYALFIFAGIFNCFGARSERIRIFAGLGRNRTFLGIMFFIAVVQCLMIYFGGALFRSVPLTSGELFFTVALASSVLLFDWIRRLLFVLFTVPSSRKS